MIGYHIIKSEHSSGDTAATTRARAGAVEAQHSERIAAAYAAREAAPA